MVVDDEELRARRPEQTGNGGIEVLEGLVRSKMM
jgi:hypothetical protein